MCTVACERNLPLRVEEEKQGIVSILGSNSRGPKPPAAASIRRTLSADMSSKKWLAENDFHKPPVMKRITSSSQLLFLPGIDQSSSSEDEEEELVGKKFDQNPKQDLWSSIVSQKKTEELPPPYVHQLLKKSSSSLSLKSLEICTEGLGSETGSDKVALDTGCDKVEEPSSPQGQQDKEISQNSYSEETPEVVKCNYPAASKKKFQPKCFPPPIPSLAGSTEGASVHMHSHRQNGRLVLKAVSSPSTKKLQAHRQDGRLRLTFIQTPEGQPHVQQPDHDKAVLFDQKEYIIEDNHESVFNIPDANDIEGHDYEITKDIKEGIDEIRHSVTKQGVPELARERMIHIQRSALVMKKMMEMENQNPTWPHKFNLAAVKNETESVDGKDTTLPKSLPPRPRKRPMPATPPPPAAASFNAYEYFWWIKPAASGLKNPDTRCSTLKNNTSNKIPAPNKPKSYEQQELLALRTCRKAMRSLLSWDAYCIVTT